MTTDQPLGSGTGSHSDALPGLRLQQAREARGLSPEDVASRLNISAKYILALEASDFDKLPGVAFTKGYIRAYARFVNLPGDELIAAFDLVFEGDSGERPVASINKLGRQAKLSDPIMRVSVVLFVAALLGISLWWWQGQSESPLSGVVPSPTPAEAVPSSPVIDPADIQSRLATDAPAEPTQEGLESIEQPAEAAVEESAEEPQYLSPEEIERLAREMAAQASTPVVEEPEPAVVVEIAPSEPALVETAPSEPALPVVEKQLVMTFSDECWVSIRDASDKLVYASNKKAGETLEFLVEPPAKLLVGRVSAVTSAELAGEPLDLASVARNNVARLTLE